MLNTRDPVEEAAGAVMALWGSRSCGHGYNIFGCVINGYPVAFCRACKQAFIKAEHVRRLKAAMDREKSKEKR